MDTFFYWHLEARRFISCSFKLTKHSSSGRRGGEQEIWVMNSVLTHFPHCTLRSFPTCVRVMTRTHFTLIHHSILLQTRHAALDSEKGSVWTVSPCSRVMGWWWREGKVGEHPWSWWTSNPVAKGLSKSQTERTPHLCLHMRINVCARLFVRMCWGWVVQKARNTVKHDLRPRIDQRFSHTLKRSHVLVIPDLAPVSPQAFLIFLPPYLFP